VSSSELKISFALAPLAEIAPWENESGRYLHWFGLTDGIYDLTIEGQSIFEYTDAALTHFDMARPDSPGAQYQVARLFHDLCWVMSAIIDDPVPLDVHKFVDSPDKLARLVQQRKDSVEEHEWDRANDALIWLSERTIDSGHLVQGPHLSFWRHKDDVYVWCDSDDRMIDGKNVWAYSPIFGSIPVAEFEAEVEGFQTSLLDAMGTRIDAIERGGQLDESIRIDMAELRDQHETETSMPELRRSASTATDWHVAAEALHELWALPK